MAAVMIRSDLAPAYLEQVVVHELLHIKLWGLDQMIEESLNALFRSWEGGYLLSELTDDELREILFQARNLTLDMLVNRD